MPMHHKHLPVLLAVAMFRQDGTISLSTTRLAQELEVSQQSASRMLTQMEKEGFLRRSVSKKGQVISFTKKGEHYLRQAYAQLQSALNITQPKKIEGTVVSGFGEGKYYMSQQGYKRQFRQKLGYVPFEGTLNLKVTPAIGNAVYEDPTFFRIEGFTTQSRTFGGLRCKKALVEGDVQGAIIIPDRTAHDAETIEIIAPMSLKQRLRLKNGSKICIEF